MNFTHKLLYGFAGFLVGNSLLLVVALSFGYLGSSQKNPAKPIDIEKTSELIRSGVVNRVEFAPGKAELLTTEGHVFVVKVSSDPVRELLITEISRYNAQQPGSQKIATTETNESSGWIWLVLFSVLNSAVGMVGLILVGALIGALLVHLRGKTVR